MAHLGEWGWVILKLLLAAAAIGAATAFDGLERLIVLAPAALVSVIPPLNNWRQLRGG